MFWYVGVVIAWVLAANSLPMLPQGIILLVVVFVCVLLCGLILVILWQKPAELSADKQAP